MHPRDDKQGFRGIPRTQDELLPAAAGGEQPLFPRLPQHTARAIQISPGQHNLGVQAHHEERGGHRSADPPETIAERRIARTGRPQFLPDLFDRYPAARLLRGDGHVAYGRISDARLHLGVHLLAGRGEQDKLPIGTDNCRQRLVYTGVHRDVVEVRLSASDGQSDQDYRAGDVHF